MRETLFRIGPVPIRGYGLMMAIAFLVATYIAARRAEKEGVPSQTIFDLGLYLLISGVLGARIFHVLQHHRDYESLWDIIGIWQSGSVGLSGLSFYGGFILALVVGVLYLHWKKLSIAKVADIIAPSMALGVGIGRIGCFLGGCCFGKPTSLPWGVSFPEGSFAWIELGLQKIHPTQLYSTLSLFSIFIILLILRKYMKFPGQLFLSFVLMYSIHRFLMDFLRYYIPEERIGSLATSQVMSIIAGTIALAIMIVITRQRSPVSSSKGKNKERV